MRKLSSLLVLSFLIVFSNSTIAQNFDNAGEYMGHIGKQQENISKKFMSYVSASAHGKRAKKVEALRNKLLDEVQEARMNISGMPSFKGDKSYRDTAVNFMKLYYNVLNEDYSKIVNMEEIAEQSYDGMEAYLLAQEMVDKKLEEGNEKMKTAGQQFAAKNNINLVESTSKLGEMTKQVSEMNKYYHELYLIFFKAYVQEGNMTEAISKSNITGMEQSKNALLSYAQEGLEKLKTTKSFQGNSDLITVTRSILNFYVKEVKGPINNITDYFLTKEKFESTKKEFEKKSSPTKDDRDNYNKMVNEINKASQAYNSSNQTLYKERTDALNEYNKTVSNFFSEFTPRYK